MTVCNDPIERIKCEALVTHETTNADRLIFVSIAKVCAVNGVAYQPCGKYLT